MRKSIRSTTAVSFKGDNLVIDALNLLARERGTTVGEMVFAAIDEKYGKELKPILSFFRKRDYTNSQLAGETDNA